MNFSFNDNFLKNGLSIHTRLGSMLSFPTCQVCDLGNVTYHHQICVLKWKGG